MVRRFIHPRTTEVKAIPHPGIAPRGLPAPGGAALIKRIVAPILREAQNRPYPDVRSAISELTRKVDAEVSSVLNEIVRREAAQGKKFSAIDMGKFTDEYVG